MTTQMRMAGELDLSDKIQNLEECDVVQLDKSITRVTTAHSSDRKRVGLLVRLTQNSATSHEPVREVTLKHVLKLDDVLAVDFN